MSRVKLLDDQTAQRLNTILDEFYNEVETGAPPTETLRKLASVHNLTPDYIRLLGRAYNSGMTNYFIHGVKKADGVHKFPLCDPEAVVRDLFHTPAKKKTAAVSTDFAADPHELGIDEEPAPAVDPFPKAADYRSIQSIEDEVRSIYQDTLKKRAEYEMAMHGWAVGLDSALGELAQYFRTVPCTDPVEVRLNAEAAGIPASSLLKQAGITEETRPWYVTGQPVNWEARPYSLLKRASECLQKFRIAEQHYTRLDEECRKMESRFGFKTNMPQAGLPLLDGPIAKALLTRVMKTAQQGQQGAQRGGRGGRGGGRGGGGRGGRPRSSDGEDGQGRSLLSAIKFKDLATSTLDTMRTTGAPLATLFRQGHKEFLKSKSLQKEEFQSSLVDDNSRETLILLTDFMMNDSIISQFDPDDVLRTFKEITAIAPHVVTQPDILRSTLRKTLAAGGLEPLDVRMLIDLDKRLGARAFAMERYYNRDDRDENP
jgi:hypothetical protein